MCACVACLRCAVRDVPIDVSSVLWVECCGLCCELCAVGCEPWVVCVGLCTVGFMSCLGLLRCGFCIVCVGHTFYILCCGICVVACMWCVMLSVEDVALCVLCCEFYMACIV